MTGNFGSLYLDTTRTKRASDRTRRRYGALLLLVVFIAPILLGKVYLERQTISMGLEWEQKHRALAAVNREVANLRVRKEAYLSGRYILSQAGELGLRPSQSGQVRSMRPAAPVDGDTTGELIAMGGE